MLELVYITVLETVAERIRGSTPLLPTTAPAPQGSGILNSLADELIKAPLYNEAFGELTNISGNKSDLFMAP